MMSTLLVVVIVLAIAFDYINGFHDAANSIATVVSTKVLTPAMAVLWAAIFNFAAYFYFTDHKVANTIAKTVLEEYITLEVIFAGLLAAIGWNLFTWYYGVPSSSSHTLIGGFAGSGMAYAFILGADPIHAINIDATLKIIAFIVLAPIIGMTISVIITLIVINLAKNSRPSVAEKWFKILQLVSSAALSFAHGGNDAQKVMGIILVAMVAGGYVPTTEHMPEWIPLTCYAAIAAGTMSGGWKIVKTMGTKITKVTPLEGVCAESAGAVTLGITEHFGIPASTTHTITGAIIGVGVVKRVSAVRWGVTISLLWAWILTIPVSALLGALSLLVVHYLL
ncbi:MULTISPECIES: inorganic phosphate transporter [Sphingobacterium]|uniref:Inorganic phosphate transporter n=6 Tax=Sphingobacterium TaxID=28453 RepID=A0ACD5BXF6_9SPHI|nr:MULTISPECIES: inorganic phosphate transporter [Sphingobacterium]APU95024.1 inorganic phosphate transporter [Sphingobacterium sp. B29]KKO93323.1 inorganic phosphate transporter [Sphingobacterium sp. Ag1]MBB1644692.1 inorganic phosphate transporter [Sphingobacterium sp. UME9]MCS4168441.1 PiT family inorganic phosphate transporter [Sphingobacterium sp. BIGb0116]MDF2852844.1 inorganic phosphate transporter [Sphingobacterium multivorum]